MAENETRPNNHRYETTALNDGGFEKKGGYPGGRRPPNATPKPPTPTAFSTPVQKPQASEPKPR